VIDAASAQENSAASAKIIHVQKLPQRLPLRPAGDTRRSGCLAREARIRPAKHMAVGGLLLFARAIEIGGIRLIDQSRAAGARPQSRLPAIWLGDRYQALVAPMAR